MAGLGVASRVSILIFQALGRSDAGPWRRRVVRYGGAGVRNPRKEETAERKGRGLVGRDLWGFEGRGRIARVVAGAGGAQCYR